MDTVISKIGDADKVILRHLRSREIRWLMLILFLPVSPCFLGVILIGLASGEPLDIVEWVYRLIVPVYHDISVELLGRDGEVFAEHVSRPQRAAEGEDLVRRVLLAARDARCTVHEVIGKGAAGVVGTWDGAHPLLHDEPDVARAEAILESLQTVSMERTADATIVASTHKGLGRVGAAVLLLVFGLLLWVLVFTANGRRMLRGLWWDLTGVDPARVVVRASRDGIQTWTERGEQRWDERSIPAADIVAIGHMRERLSYNAQVSRVKGGVTVITTTGLFELPAGAGDERDQVGPALAELLVARLR